MELVEAKTFEQGLDTTAFLLLEPLEIAFSNFLSEHIWAEDWQTRFLL